MPNTILPPSDPQQNAPLNDPAAIPFSPKIPDGMLLGEKASEIFIPNNETQPAREQEKETITNLAPEPKKAVSKNTPDAVQTQPSAKVNVVNKATRKETLHPVGPKADVTTIAADKEEAEFITNVEETHANK